MARKKKPTFTVVVYYSKKKTYEITADDRTTAEAIAHERCENEEEPECVDDVVAENCDYPDQQELLDRENEDRIRL